MQKTFHYISDLHLNRNVFNVKFLPPYHNLFIAGDIGNPRYPIYKDFLYGACAVWDNVYFTSGNHEYFGCKTIDEGNEVDDILTKMAKGRPNLEYLQKRVIETDEYLIAGATLWTRPLCKGQYNTEIHTVHEDHVKFIESLSAVKKNVIMMTHHLPSHKLILPQYKKHSVDKYATDLEYLIGDPIKVWICGHSHISYQKKINDVLFLIRALKPEFYQSD